MLNNVDHTKIFEEDLGFNLHRIIHHRFYFKKQPQKASGRFTRNGFMIQTPLTHILNNNHGISMLIHFAF